MAAGSATACKGSSPACSMTEERDQCAEQDPGVAAAAHPNLCSEKGRLGFVGRLRLSARLRSKSGIISCIYSMLAAQLHEF